ncbi:DUF6760 family protein [Streptomyces flavofungini]|uniref:DUF6760 family protein n=1 Tax=Streptomyces flavofungini TaxID=68200 RepID=UPI0034DFF101
MTYATDRLHEEIAYVAYHFHWGLESILDLEHHDRRRYADRIASFVTRAASGASGTSGASGAEG